MNSPDAPAIVNKGGGLRGSKFWTGWAEKYFTSWKRLFAQNSTAGSGANRNSVYWRWVSNNVFGYYIEVTHTHKDKPSDWTTKANTHQWALHHGRVKNNEYEENSGARRKDPGFESRLFTELVQVITVHSTDTAECGIDRTVRCVVVVFRCVLKNEYVRPVEWFFRHWHPQRSSSGDWKATLYREKVYCQRYLSSTTIHSKYWWLPVRTCR